MESTCAFNTRPSSGFSGIPGRTQAPRRLLPPLLAQASARSPTDSRVVCQGGGGDPDGSLPAPIPRSTLARLLLFFFLRGRSAKGLRKLPARGPSRARSRGPDTPQIRRAPAPAPRAALSPPRSPHPDPTELAGPRRRPRQAAWGAAAPPAGRRSRAQERAVSPPEVPNFTLAAARAAYNTWEPEENILDPRLLIAFQNRERQEQLMGYRKRGPKPKPLVVQVPTFARRSNVLTGLQDSSTDNRAKLDLGAQGKGQGHQYELNSKKHHQYQPHSKERAGKPPPPGKSGKYYYQLNSKKHHPYQPDPKMYDLQYQGGHKEAPSPTCPDLGAKSHPPDKWAQGAGAKGYLGAVKPLAGAAGAPGKGSEKGPPNGMMPAPKEAVTGNGIGGKMKIVKNKNKNGRIVIVMSKYMENGMQAVKIKSGEVAEGEARSPSHKKRAAEERHPPADRTFKKAAGAEEKKVEAPPKRREEEVSGVSDPQPQDAGSRKLSPTKEAFGEQPLQLTTKPDLLAWDPSRSTHPPSHHPHPHPHHHHHHHHHHHTVGLNLSHVRKRCLSETHGEREPCKKRLTARSISTPTCLGGSPAAERPADLPPTATLPQPEVILLDSDLDEPIDLRCVKTRSEAGEPPSSLQVKPETPASAAVAAVAVAAAPTTAAEKPPAEAQDEPAESLSEFKPFFGNIIITDVTANCLTVTFKEYVTV
uniref:Chromobox 4 n=2 Tax=Mandrillus leucophaeus TaxID=9568 RepID=A0A2K5Z6D3_MANLE